MQAILFEDPGHPEDVLQLGDISIPSPGKNQVLIKVAGRTIQPADFLFITGNYRIEPVFPQTAGLEGAGTVAACGPGAQDLTAGMRVAFYAPGAWAEYAVAPVSRVYPVPEQAPDTLACQFALNPLTAWALFAECRLHPGSRLLITAGRSIVAGILAGIAIEKGVQAFLLARDGAGYAVREASGRKRSVKGASVAEALQDIARQQPFQAIADAVGGPGILDLMDILEPGGRLVSYGLLDDRDITLKASRILFKNMVWQGFGIGGWLDAQDSETLQTMQRELWEILLRIPDLLPVAQSFPLAKIQQAIQAALKPPRSGKVVLIG